MRVAPRPILVYSKRATPEEKKAAMKAGAQGYQIEPHDLFNVAEHAVKGSSPGPQPGRGESLQPLTLPVQETPTVKSTLPTPLTYHLSDSRSPRNEGATLTNFSRLKRVMGGRAALYQPLV